MRIYWDNNLNVSFPARLDKFVYLTLALYFTGYSLISSGVWFRTRANLIQPQNFDISCHAGTTS